MVIGNWLPKSLNLCPDIASGLWLGGLSSKILLTLNLKKMLNFNDRDNSYLQSICEFLQEYPDKADSKQFFKVFGQC